MNVKEYKVNNKILEILEREQKVLIFNTENNRLIVTNSNVYNYLEDNINEKHPLYDFVESRTKNNCWKNINILKLKVNEKYLSPLFEFINIINHNYLSIVMIILNFIILSIVYKDDYSLLVKIYKGNYNFSSLILYLFFGSLLITFFHEVSHFVSYKKYMNHKYFIVGITVRYLSMILFYTKVPFINSLRKEEKIDVILSGVRMQIFISFLLGTIVVIFPSDFIIILFFQNLTIIFLNLLPFLRLDGYWLLNVLMDKDDYMKEFILIIKRKTKFNIIIFLLGILNITLIIYMLYSTLLFIISLI